MTNAVEKCNVFNFNPEDDDLEKFMSVPKNLIAENQNLYEEIEENLPTDVGMDVMSLDIFETLIEHLLNKGKIRDAMLLTLHANWGLRNSDVASTRVFEVLKPDGTFRKKVCKSEQKTGKLRNLYINNACRVAIATYLRSNPEKQMLDYLVTAEGNHKKYETATVKLSDGNVHEYTCIAALTRMSEERIIKNNLLELEVALSNDKRCKDNEGLKLNTHSLRKLYAEELGNTAYRLKQEGKIALDMQITQLCMLDLNHSDEKCTLRYIKHFERQKEIICNEMNLGLRQWLNYLKSQA